MASPQAQSAPPARPLLERRRFTVEDYRRMLEAGILRDGERVELLDGDVVVMAAMGVPHEGCVDFLSRFFTLELHREALTRTQNSVRLDAHSEPEPDVALVRLPAEQYRRRKPGPDDVLLLVEVGDASAERDREVKARLYARAGIPELWLVDVPAGVVRVCREPTADGYARVVTRGRGDELAPSAFPACRLAVDDVLGPKE